MNSGFIRMQGLAHPPRSETNPMTTRLIIAALIAAIFLPSCSHPSSESAISAGGDTLTVHSSLLTMTDYPQGGTTLVEIRNPWDSTGVLSRMALVPRDSAVPEWLPADYAVVRTPVRRMAVFSGVHTSALVELGGTDALAAVADGGFFAPDDMVSALLREGRVADVGAAASPSVEKLTASRVEAVLLSPMQGQKLPQLPRGICAVEMADYLETTPIGRAEWILLIGKLLGKYDEAAQIFKGVVDEYNALQFKAALCSTLPLVITETEYAGTWYVPAGESYMSRMISDAGARTPWTGTPGTGSLSLDMARVLADGIDADFWLIRTYGSEPTLAGLKAANPLNAKFKAFREGGVYGCDSSVRPIFNDVAFHPERVLADMVAIFHPSLMPGYEPRYYRKAE